MIRAGSIIKTPGMTLRVTEVRGRYLKCEYLDSAKKEWLPRAVTENRSAVEQRIADGKYELIEE